MEVTDRELLELAAKAAGYSLRWHDAWKCFVHVGPHNITNPPTLAGQRNVWVPFDDDGDALRLVSTLGIHLQFATGFAVAYAGSVHAKQFTERNGTDQHAATRRAIVRAAAAMAQSLPATSSASSS